MKKFTFFTLTVAMSVLTLSSCLRDGTEVSGSTYGVFRATGSKYGTPVFNSAMGPFYSPAMETNMLDGKCYYIAFVYRSNDPENSYASLEQSGYYTITVTGTQALDTYNSANYRSDTSKVFTNELTFYNGYISGSGSYFDNMLVMQHDLYLPDRAQINWDLSFNVDAYPYIEGGYRYYDMFIRAYCDEAPSSVGTERKAVTNAYNVGDFMTAAAYREYEYLKSEYNYNAETSKFRLRIYYPYQIENGKIDWRYSTEEVPIYAFLSYEE
jgi:hypothetical protein